jgi:hypothetical protein
MPKMKKYATFMDWKRDQTVPNKRLIAALQRIVNRAAPALKRSTKWGQGCFVDGDAPKLYIHAAKDHVQLGFYRGATLHDPQRLLRGRGKYVRHIKVRSTADIRPPAFTKLIEQAITKPPA